MGFCASECFFIYVAAVDRNSMSLSLGIHRPYFDHKEWSNLTLSVAERRHRELSETVRSYLHEQQVPQSLVEKMFNLAALRYDVQKPSANNKKAPSFMRTSSRDMNRLPDHHVAHAAIFRNMRGLSSATLIRVFAAALGSRRPCSHSWSVRTETPSSAANCD